MEKRQIVQIPTEQVKKLIEIDNIRKDLVGYPISRKVHVLLQEKLKEIFKEEPSANEEWFEYIRDAIPLHIVAPIALGVVKYSKDFLEVPFTKVLVTNEGDKTWWANNKKDIYSVGRNLIEILKDNKFAKKYYARYDLIIQDMRGRCKELRNEDFTKLPMNKLLDKYKNFNDAFMKFHALVMDIDAIDICLEEAMKKKFEEVLSKKGNFSKKEFSFKYSLLTNPTELSYINVEEIEVYKLAKELSSVKHIFDEDIPAIIRSIKSKNKYVENKVNKLVNNFWWTTLGWVEKKEKSFEDYIIQIKDIFDSKKDIDKELNRLSGFIKQTKLDQEKLSNELDFDDEIRYYLRLFEKYVVLHDYRKENQVKGTSIMNKFLFELSRRDGLKYDDLSWAWPSEIEEYIKTGKIDLESIRLRKGACLILVSEMGIECLTGEKAIQRRKKELRSDVENVYDFEGIGVSLGKVSGKAKICYSSSDAIKKIEKGDILVASMTLPDYVPAMKKAAAIVTDEGGVTSHAAIVSRELGIPCVSGTKIATRVLKDNDFIEVNANHGRVKILKRA